jgi:hypothetical protein
MEVKGCVVWINIKNNNSSICSYIHILYCCKYFFDSIWTNSGKKYTPQQQQPSPANLRPFDAKLQYYPPNPTQTADFRPIIINPEPDRNQSCEPYLDRFLMNLPRVSLVNVPRFLIQAQCVTIVGIVSWTHYFNHDGDANFNVVPDPQYGKYMSAGNFAPYFISKYGTPAIHMEVVCQGPIIGGEIELGTCL